MLFQFILNGLTMGSIYAVVAIGVTIIYKSIGMLNVAHGDTIMLGTFVCLTLHNLGLALYLAIPITIVIMAFFGLFLERVIYRQLNYDSFTNLLIATIGMATVFRNGAMLIWGAEPLVFPDVFSTQTIKLGKYVILPQNIGIICVCIVLVTVLQLFFYKTKIGKQLRAAASDPEAAKMIGINVNATRCITFGLSGALAAVAGILLGPMYYASATMGSGVVLKGFAAAIIGSFGNIIGAVFGGILLGIVEALGAGYISSAYRDVIAFLVLFLVLYFKPNGLFSKSVEQKL